MWRKCWGRRHCHFRRLPTVVVKAYWCIICEHHIWFVSDHIMGLVPTICCTIKILVKANRMNFSTCVISAMFQKFLCICVCGWLGLRMKLIPQYTLFKAINILPFSLMPWDLGVNFKLLLAGSLRELCNSLRAYTGNWVLIEACLVSSWVGC